MITDESAASPAAASSCLGSHETDISLSRLALGDAETPCNLAVALADGHAEPSREHPLKTDSTDPPGITASGAADKHAILHSNAQSAVAPSSSQSPAPATVNNMFGDAVPSTRMESTGMMASIPAPQGRHIRYDANSDSEGRLAQPPSSTAEAGPSETCCSELNSVDQHALLNAVAAVDTPACNDSSNGSDSFVCDGGGVSDVVIEDAMQGVLATTVVAPAQLHKDAQASSVVTGVPDPPPDRQTASLAQSTFHAASNVSHQLDRACLSHQSHTASHEDGMQSAALETLADSHSHDHGEDDQREQPDTTACSIPEVNPPLVAAFEEETSEQSFCDFLCVWFIVCTACLILCKLISACCQLITGNNQLISGAELTTQVHASLQKLEAVQACQRMSGTY